MCPVYVCKFHFTTCISIINRQRGTMNRQHYRKHTHNCFHITIQAHYQNINKMARLYDSFTMIHFCLCCPTAISSCRIFFMISGLRRRWQTSKWVFSFLSLFLSYTSIKRQVNTRRSRVSCSVQVSAKTSTTAKFHDVCWLLPLGRRVCHLASYCSSTQHTTLNILISNVYELYVLYIQQTMELMFLLQTQTGHYRFTFLRAHHSQGPQLSGL